MCSGYELRATSGAYEPTARSRSLLEGTISVLVPQLSVDTISANAIDIATSVDVLVIVQWQIAMARGLRMG